MSEHASSTLFSKLCANLRLWDIKKMSSRKSQSVSTFGPCQVLLLRYRVNQSLSSSSPIAFLKQKSTQMIKRNGSNGSLWRLPLKISNLSVEPSFFTTFARVLVYKSVWFMEVLEDFRTV